LGNITTKLKDKAIRAVIFDKDGTLFEFEKTWMRYCDRLFDELVGEEVSMRAKLAEACGFDIVNRSFIPGSLIVGGSIEELCQGWAALLPEHSLDDVIRLSGRIIGELVPEPLCDLPTLVKTLRESGILLGVITNDLESAARSQFQSAGIENEFDLILGSDSGYRPKPEPDSILAFCNNTGIAPAEVAMVGDSLHDMKAAKRSGAGLAVGVLTGPAGLSVLSLREKRFCGSQDQCNQHLEK